VLLLISAYNEKYRLMLRFYDVLFDEWNKSLRGL